METTTASAVLDRRGKAIATYVVFDAAAELRMMREGELLELVTDDFEPLRRRLRVVRCRRSPLGRIAAQIRRAPVCDREGSPENRRRQPGSGRLLRRPRTTAFSPRLRACRRLGRNGRAPLHPRSCCAGPHPRIPTQAARLGPTLQPLRRRRSEQGWPQLSRIASGNSPLPIIDFPHLVDGAGRVGVSVGQFVAITSWESKSVIETGSPQHGHSPPRPILRMKVEQSGQRCSPSARWPQPSHS